MEKMKLKCKKCGNCCRKYPCGIVPSEIVPIAKFLKVSVRELFEKYLIGDYWVGDNTEDIYITPRRRTDGGDFRKASFSWAWSNEPCIFLTDEKLCLIHDVKPQTGKDSHCKVPLRSNYKQPFAEMWKEYFNDKWESYDQLVNYDKLEKDFS